MLLQFLSIFFQCVFLHCGVPANGKDDFLDYSITEFWWSSSPGIDQTDRITPQYSFLTTPIGWLLDGGPPPPIPPKSDIPPEILETFFPFPNTTRPSYPFDIQNHTVVKPTFVPGYDHIQYPGLTPPPNFPPDYRYPTIYPYRTVSYIPSPTGPTPKGPSFSFPTTAVDLDEFTRRDLLTPVPTGSLPGPPEGPFTTTRKTIPPYVKEWQQEISSYAAAESRTTTDVPVLSQVFNYDYKMEGAPEAIRRIRKTPQDAGSILKSSVFKDQTQSILREEITKGLKTQRGGGQKIEDDNDIKETTSRKIEQNTASHRYFEKIKTLKEGYMMVFLIELTRLVATKEREAVRDVVKHTDQIIYGFYKRKQLLWFGQPLTDVTGKVARFLKDSTIDIIQNHAANLYHMLSERSQELSVEVNTVLEYADMLYDDDEGSLLFDALKEFAAYPNISLTGYWLCNSLIHNFLRPYRRLKDTQQRHELIESVNLELKTRFNWSGFIEEPNLRGGDIKGDGSPDETKLSTPIEPVIQTKPHSDFTWSPKERKRKRHHRLHKRKRGRKRHHRSHKRKRERKRYTHPDMT